MITDGKTLHYLEVIRLSALLKKATSRHNGGFYCLNCFHSLRTESKLHSHEKVYKGHSFCQIVLSTEDKRFKYEHGSEVIKFQFELYVDLKLS